MDKHYHFIGVGGIGMGALANLLLAKGAKVSGSDAKDNAITISLKEKGATIYSGHEAKNVHGSDFVIFSSAIHPQNPEILEARKKRIPIIPRARLLADLMHEYTSITVAGAHGKTTTTSMVSHMLMQTNFNPTTAIGGIVNGTNMHAQLGQGQYFVSEVDESDGSFLFFTPKYSLITNIDYEHLDFYQNWENILKVHREFIQRTMTDGIIIGCGDDKNLKKLLEDSGRRYQTYGFHEDNDMWARKVKDSHFGSHYVCYYQGKKLGEIELSIPGEHNILNSMACVSLGLHLNIEFEKMAETLKGFRGVQRRFQVLANSNDIRVVDDYAHHPTEIKATLQAARSLKTNRLIVIFQPHRYSRMKALNDEFAQSLLNVDHLVLTDIYAASEKPIEGVTSANLVAQIKKLSQQQSVYLKKEDIQNHLKTLIRPGDLVLFLGAGDITKIAHDFSQSLIEIHATSKT